ncbi:MAG TPA: fibronectin type III domain-containing protein [Phycisphaerales bacterium]|nr:fibronectin type III domain-containing protein [Phycisphaerales bacterium]
MAVLPNGRKAKVQFFKDRKSKLIAQAANVGLSPAAVTALFAKIDKAETDGQAAVDAHNTAKSATQKYYATSDDAISDGREVIRTVKAFAATQADPAAVLALVDIPEDAPPSPAVAPSVPTNIRGSISTDGILTIAWDAKESGPSAGIVFMIHRKLQGEGEFRLIGATFTKQYIDTGFEPSMGVTAYKVLAQRGSLTSPWSTTMQVDLGVGGSGFSMLSSKMAA